MTEIYCVKRETLSDTHTPVSAYVKLCDGRPDSFLLESVETRESTGRYSIVAYDPLFGIELGAHEGRVFNGGDQHPFAPPAFFDELRNALKSVHPDMESRIPSVGSLIGYVGYDAVRLIERLPTNRHSDLPVARLVFPSRFVVFDHLKRVMILMALDYDRRVAQSKLDEMDRILSSSLHMPGTRCSLTVDVPDRDRYCTAVDAAKEYIRAGDIFQVVLSDSFQGRTELSPFQVYRRLRVNSPSPYMFFLNHGGFQMLGASPEMLVRVENGTVTVRPIAGTRGRSDDATKDRLLEEELRASDKEGAEHLMLVDLARNDVGRVSEYGSITVDPFRTVERYSHVMHIVSQVRGKLKQDKDIVDAFMAGFPAGTVSGAPKVRAMEIIDELEDSSRGPYAGAVGYFGPSGAMDTCIAIRTVLFRGDEFTVRVGAGIVADSLPEMEYKEITDKAAQSIHSLKKAAEESL